MENTEKKINKTQFVRDVLARIGAFGKNCPDDWHQQVVQALQAEGIEMHPNAIYGVKNRAMDKLKQANRFLRRGKRHEHEDLSQDSIDLKIADLITFQQFVKSFGGMERVKNAIKAIEALNQ